MEINFFPEFQNDIEEGEEDKSSDEEIRIERSESNKK